MSNFQSGQVILDIAAYELGEQEREVLCHPQVGGVILFARNYHDPQQLSELTRAIKRLNPSLLLAVDQEGGRVQRFRTGFTRLPPMSKLGELHAQSAVQALTLARDLGWLMAAELRRSGVDLSFAPVLDVNYAASSVIGDRAFASAPEMVSVLAGEFISGMAEVGMKATGKHFPGHGSVAADSHLELPVDPRCFEDIQQADLIPFVQLKDKLAAVMPAHIVFAEVDSQPVGFSRHWLQQILRQQLGFSGLVLSDDLSMAGAAFAGAHPDRALCALEAGCDAVLVCNNPNAAHAVIEVLEAQGVKSNQKLRALMPQQIQNPPLLPPLEKQSRWQLLQRTLGEMLAI